MPFPSLLPSTLYHEDSSCAAYAISPAYQRSQPNARKVVSCQRFSIVISSIPESLLPLLKSAVPYVSATSQPRSPRHIGSPFVEILPGVFYLPGIASEPVLPAPQRIEFVVFAANVQSTRHSPCPKSFPVDTSAFPFPASWNESLHPALIHPARSALSDFPPSQPNIPFIEPPAAQFFKTSTLLGSAVEGFLLFSPLRRDISPFHHIDALLHPAPVSRNPESKTHCCCPCSRPFLLPKTQKNSGKLFACRCLCVGVNLSSRAVSSQVLSAPVSLTSVFDMGTGGPSL